MLRKIRGSLSTIELATRCGCSGELVRLVETGGRLPRNELFFAWLNACDPDEEDARLAAKLLFNARNEKHGDLLRAQEELSKLAFGEATKMGRADVHAQASKLVNIVIKTYPEALPGADALQYQFSNSLMQDL